MLTKIRDHATGWIAWFIVILIVIPFAFFGLNNYVSGPEADVASVNGEEISQQDYRIELDQRRNTLRRLLAENFNPELVNSMEFRRDVLDEMINQRLLVEDANERGYSIGDEALGGLIRTYPQFQIDGKFSADAYRGFMRSRGLTESGFEAQLRQQTTLQQVREGLENSAFVIPGEQERLLELIMQEREFDYAVLSASDHAQDITVSDDEIQSEYESNSDRYQTPDQIRVEYVQLAIDDLVEDALVSEQELLDAYESDRSRFVQTGKRSASHILVTLETDADDQTEAKALEKANEILAKAQTGEDFAALANQYSEDPGSAPNGGNLGTVEAGDMVKPFEDALFALTEVNQLAGPVKTRFGYHIIKLTEYEPDVVRSFEEVRESLKDELGRDFAEAIFLERAEDFRNISFEQSDSLQPVAEALDLEVKQSDWFSRSSGEGVANHPKVREVAFADDVFNQGLNSETIELNIDTLVVIRAKEIKSASLKPLDEVRDSIFQDIQLRKAAEHISQLGPELVSELEQGVQWEDLVEKNLLNSKQAKVSRDQLPQDLDRELVNTVFQAKRPDASQAAVYGGTLLAAGDYALFRLMEVIDADVTNASEETTENIRANLQRWLGLDSYLSYQTDLRLNAEVEIFEEQIEF